MVEKSRVTIICLDGTKSRQVDDNCLVMIKLSRWVSKNHDTWASADSPIDFVPAAGTSHSYRDGCHKIS